MLLRADHQQQEMSVAHEYILLQEGPPQWRLGDSPRLHTHTSVEVGWTIPKCSPIQVPQVFPRVPSPVSAVSLTYAQHAALPDSLEQDSFS